MDNRQFFQNINGEVNGNVNMAAGDININYNNDNSEKIHKLLGEIKKYIEESDLESVLENEEKENVLDDIQTLDEQCKADKASVVKVRKALSGIVGFAKKIPGTVKGATLLFSQMTELQDYVQKFMDNLLKTV